VVARAHVLLDAQVLDLPGIGTGESRDAPIRDTLSFGPKQEVERQRACIRGVAARGLELRFQLGELEQLIQPPGVVAGEPGDPLEAVATQTL
jgi:hypothetical protein